MELKIKILYTLLVGLAITACTKEKPIEPLERGSSKILQAPMGSDYEDIIWVDLESNKVVKAAPKNSWELAFLTKKDQPYLIMNTGMGMKAAITDSENWEDSFTPGDYDFSARHPNGDLDSIRTGKWWSHGKVILIDMGFNASGSTRGFCKWQGISYSKDSIVFKIARIDGTEEHHVSIARNNNYTQNEYSFYQNQVVQISPHKTNYDLVFTQFMHIFYEENMDYLVSGALLNRYQTTAYLDSTLKFENIDASKIDQKKLSTDRDVPGYDWKYYSLEQSSYFLIDNRSYIIQTQEGYLYLLRFIDFFNKEGEKGYPKIEYQLI